MHKVRQYDRVPCLDWPVYELTERGVDWAGVLMSCGDDGVAEFYFYTAEFDMERLVKAIQETLARWRADPDSRVEDWTECGGRAMYRPNRVQWVRSPNGERLERGPVWNIPA